MTQNQLVNFEGLLEMRTRFVCHFTDISRCFPLYKQTGNEMVYF